MKTERVAYDTQIIVKMPKSFTDALSRAAHMQMMSKSDYVRSTLAARMRNDGIEAAPAAAQDTRAA